MRMAITIPSYSTIRTDKSAAHVGELITYIHNDISYTTKHTRTLIPQNNTLEIQSLKIAMGAPRMATSSIYTSHQTHHQRSKHITYLS
jgi:hypothetical protein